MKRTLAAGARAVVIGVALAVGSMVPSAHAEDPATAEGGAEPPRRRSLSRRSRLRSSEPARPSPSPRDWSSPGVIGRPPPRGHVRFRNPVDRSAVIDGSFDDGGGGSASGAVSAVRTVVIVEPEIALERAFELAESGEVAPTGHQVRLSSISS